MSEQKKTLKEISPETYEFFKEYWDFMSQYWRVPAGTDEDWWNCFQSDLNKMLEKFDDNGFFNDTLMTFFDRCIHISEHA